MAAPKKRLGRGLDALLGNKPRTIEAAEAGVSSSLQTQDIAITALQPGQYPASRCPKKA